MVTSHTLRADGFDASEDGTGRDPCHPLRGVANAEPAIAFDIKGVPATRGATEADVHVPLRARKPGQSEASTTTVIQQLVAVRRLTPRECERLQGYPDNYTAITYRGKPASDGPRYKALGNSMAVPVMRWILERIEQVDHIARGYR